VSADTPVPLVALLGHPDWHQVSVLASPPAPTLLVEGVSLVPDIRGRASDIGGQLLTVLQPPSRNDWRIDVLIQTAAAGGASAVLIGDSSPLSQPSSALAARVGLTVLGADDPLAAALAARRFVSEAEMHVADTVLRVTSMAVRSGEGVEDVMKAVGSVLRRPLALVAAGGDTLLGTDVVLEGDRETVAQTLTAVATRSRATQRVELSGSALLIAHPVPPTTARDATMWLVTRLPHDLPAESAAASAALSVAAAVIGQRASLRRLAVERDARARASLLGELLNAPDDLAPTTRRRALEAGWRLDGWHLGVRIDTSPDVDPVAQRPEVISALREEGLEAVVVEQGDGWSAWITSEDEPRGADVEARASQIRRAQRRLSTTTATAVGVGRCHSGPRGVARTLGEAGEAARLAAGRVASGRFLHVDRLGLAQTLLAWTRTDTFQPAARSLLAPLEGQPGDLLHTLTTYLDEESSVSETAAILGIHRNTVSQRLSRIRSLLAVDLADPSERLALHLACRTIWMPPSDVG
jgi:hypothetical protein